MKKLFIVLILIVAELIQPSFVYGHTTGLASINGEIQKNILKVSIKLPEKFTFPSQDQTLQFFSENLKVSSNGLLCKAEIEKFSSLSDNLNLTFICSNKIEKLKVQSDLSQAFGLTFTSSIKKDNQVKNYTFDLKNRDFDAIFTTGAWLSDTFGKIYDFIKLGLFHIYTGYDHILFLLAVILVLSNLKQALKTVTAFTLAHSMTLILSSLGLLTLTSRIVEPIIALSIVYVAFENIFFSPERSRTGIFKRRWLIAFGFGLIHGLGFAGALSEINIPRNELLIDLLSFNIGIEIGQLTIIAVVLPILYFLNRFSWRTKLIPALSLLVGGIGSLWFLERIGFTEVFSQISIETLLQTTPLILIFSTFVLIQTGLFRKFLPAGRQVQSPILIFARRLLILSIAISITLAFVPGIFNLKPKEVQAAVPSGVIVAWPSTNASIPSGWSRVTGLDGRFPKMIATSGTNPGATGGAASHAHSFTGHTHSWPSHTHSGSWGTTGDSDSGGANGGAGDPGTGAKFAHTHVANGAAGTPADTGSGGSGNYDNATVDPPYIEVIFIKSDGTPTGIPNSAIAYFNGAAPTGWTAYASGANRFLKGAATGGNGGTTGGSADSHTHSGSATSHTHTYGRHSHTVSWAATTTPGGAFSGTGSVGTTTSHAHPAYGSSNDNSVITVTGSTTDSTTSGDGTPPWQKLLTIQNTSGSNSLPNNVIVIWDGTLASIPAGYKLCDGTNCTVNLSQGKFVRGANGSGEIGTTGGASTHSHGMGTHTHTSGDTGHTHSDSQMSGPSRSAGVSSGGTEVMIGGTTFAGDGHKHVDSNTYTSPSTTVGSTNAGTATSGANSSNDPLFTGVSYIQFQNSNPNAPTIMGSSPIPGSKPNKDATTITLQGTATDPDASDTVQIDWDYSSNSGGAWTNIGTTSLGTQGTTLSKTWTVSGLTAASTYRLRARTLDNQGAASGYTTQSADWTLTSGCSPPVSGSLTISSSCAFPETVDGVDAGNITINSAITLTINASQTVVFNSGNTISPNGIIARNSTGQIRKTNLWMVDSDADGWPSTAAQTAQDSTPGGTYRRRNVLQSDRIIDCNDAAASSTNTC